VLLKVKDPEPEVRFRVARYEATTGAYPTASTTRINSWYVAAHRAIEFGLLPPRFAYVVYLLCGEWHLGNGCLGYYQRRHLHKSKF